MMTDFSEVTRFERGLAKARELGPPPAEIRVADVGDVGRYLVEFVFGDVNSRPGLSLRDREIATVAMLTVIGREAPLGVHLKAARHLGVTWSEFEEIVLQTVPFAGFRRRLPRWSY
jgi:4-carboxymuconolactone decarboxylase